MLKVIVAGGRDFRDYQLLKNKLDKILSNCHTTDIEIVSGKAKGADSLGEVYANERGYLIKTFPADWDLGKSAGYKRNKQMAEYADAAVIFWDGVSRGSKHMIDLARECGLMVRVVRY